MILSSASFTRCTSCAWKARNTSPVPETFIRSTPSPGRHLLHQPRHAAGGGALELHLALVGDHRAELRLDRHVGQLDLQQPRVLEREALAALRLLEPLKCLLYRHGPPFRSSSRPCASPSRRRGLPRSVNPNGRSTARRSAPATSSAWASSRYGLRGQKNPRRPSLRRAGHDVHVKVRDALADDVVDGHERAVGAPARPPPRVTAARAAPNSGSSMGGGRSGSVSWCSRGITRQWPGNSGRWSRNASTSSVVEHDARIGLPPRDRAEPAVAGPPPAPYRSPVHRPAGSLRRASNVAGDANLASR